MSSVMEFRTRDSCKRKDNIEATNFKNLGIFLLHLNWCFILIIRIMYNIYGFHTYNRTDFDYL